jgi:hypothetical protein
MTRQFTQLVDDTRKQQLMSRKSARKSIGFDSPPPPARYRHEKFTPPRHPGEEIPGPFRKIPEAERPR